MGKTILIAEDEERLRVILREYLEDEDFQVIEASDGQEAIDHFHKHHIELALIDIMMPKVDGWSLCKQIREVSDIPIIIITARSREDDKLLGFELGADDYVTKPFSARVLMARIKTLLKRYSGSYRDKDNIISSGELIVDKKAYIAKLNGTNLELTPREYEILLFLLRHKSHVLTRDQILDEIWGYDYYGNSRIVDAHIKKLRKKLGTHGAYIKTVLRAGYKYEDI